MKRKTIMHKKRLTVIKAYKNRKTYVEIQKSYHVSPNFISKCVKGKDLSKLCETCGETEGLEEHHPDKKNYPAWTITLCGTCHNKVGEKERRYPHKIWLTPRKSKPQQAEASKKSATTPIIAKSIPVKPIQQPFQLSKEQMDLLVDLSKLGFGIATFFGLLDSLRRHSSRPQGTVQSAPTSKQMARQTHPLGIIGKAAVVETPFGRSPATIIGERDTQYRVQLSDASARKAWVPKSHVNFA